MAFAWLIPGPSSWAANTQDCIYIGKGKGEGWSMGLVVLRNYIRRGRTKLFKPPANSSEGETAQSLSSEATGG